MVPNHHHRHSTSSVVTAEFIIPPNVRPGQAFIVQLQGHSYQVVCPAHAYPGLKVQMQVPAQSLAAPVVVAAAPVTAIRPRSSTSSYSSLNIAQPSSFTTSPGYSPAYQAPSNQGIIPPPPQSLAQNNNANYYADPSYDGRQLFQQALAPPKPPPPPPPAFAAQRQQVVATGPKIMAMKNQIVDESAKEYAEHQIKTIYEGEEAILVGGTLENGLPPPYGDYVEVLFQDGRRGKVSKWILKLS